MTSVDQQDECLVAREIGKSHPNGTVALKDVSLSLRRGSLTVLLGANGSGKSTLLRALSLLDPPDHGTLHIERRAFDFSRPQNVADYSAVWPKLTVVFQQLFLWPHLTVFDNISLALRGDAKRLTVAHSLIEKFTLETLLARFPNELSIGQRQRVAIVRALALQPDILLLDEVTSALDVGQTEVLLGELERLRSSGTSLLLVTHLLGFAKRMADAVMFLDAGRVAEQGGANILRSPQSAELKQLLGFLD